MPCNERCQWRSLSLFRGKEAALPLSQQGAALGAVAHCAVPAPPPAPDLAPLSPPLAWSAAGQAGHDLS